MDGFLPVHLVTINLATTEINCVAVMNTATLKYS